MKKIVVAVDSFKGCLQSDEIAECVTGVIHEYHPDCEVIEVDISDGGEGMARSLTHALGGSMVCCTVSGPLGEPVKAWYGRCGEMAIIEMASASGLPLVQPELRNPELTSSYGTGELIAHAVENGAKRLILGIGGSATNDAGMGMLGALGVKFYAENGPLDPHIRGCDLAKITHIDTPELNPECSFTIACDVTNPLYGPNGATYVYGPQKGADQPMVQRLDGAMERLSDLIIKERGIDIGHLPGSGAAGGMGGGAVAFLGATLISGIELVLNLIDFETTIHGADLVITGEGAMDAQTLMGKAPSGVLAIAKAQGVTTIAIAGRIEQADRLHIAGFDELLEISPRNLPLNIAMQPQVAADNIANTLRNYFNTLKNSQNE